jgi:hypothetical protein
MWGGRLRGLPVRLIAAVVWTVAQNDRTATTPHNPNHAATVAGERISVSVRRRRRG